MTGFNGHKTENFSKIAKRLVGLTVALLLFFSTSVTALAYDSRYLESTYWQEQNAVTVPVDTGGAQGYLTGSIKYFTRDESAYFLFDLSESPNNGSNFFFEFSSEEFSSEKYNFSVNENGIFNMADSEVVEKYFNIGVNFYTDNTGHGICIIVMDINDRIYTHYFNIHANVNGYRYKIAEELEIITYPPPQTTKPEKTTVPKQTTTKAQKETTTKSTTEKTTKFKYVPEAAETRPTTLPTTESVSYEYYDASGKQNTKTLSKRQIIMYAIAAVLACLGMLILGLSLARPKHKKKNSPKSENDSEDDEIDKNDKPTDDDDYDF